MERPAPSVFVRRRLVAAAVLLLVVAGIAAAAGAFSGGGGDPPAGKASTNRAAPAPPQLPGGGRQLLPDRRIVAFYGAPQDPELGTLGIGTPEQAARRLARQARAYARPHRPVLPALELIASVAAADPGEDGMYRTRQAGAVIDRYLRAARRHGMLLLLDIQPGRSDFFTETVRLRRWLKEPDVGLALDPEWRVTGSEVPGQVIGHAEPRELNATTAWLDQLAAARDLPQKLLVIHQFTDDMVDAAQLQPRSRLAMVLNADGFGSRPVKISKYRAFTREGHDFGQGFKLFFHEDVGLMTPRQVLRLRPAPDVVVYE